MIRWIFVFLWAGMIFYLSSIPNLSSGLEADFILRKFAHIFVYFILTVLVFYALWGKQKASKDVLKTSLLAFCLSFLYALSDEYHQTFVFGRSGSLKDVLINLVGVGLAVFLLNKFKFIPGSKNKKQSKDGKIRQMPKKL